MTEENCSNNRLNQLDFGVERWHLSVTNGFVQSNKAGISGLSLARCKTKTLPVRNWVAWSRYVSHLSSLNADKATIWETAATLLIAVLLNPFFIPCLPFPSVILQTMTNENMPLFVLLSYYVILTFPVKSQFCTYRPGKPELHNLLFYHGICNLGCWGLYSTELIKMIFYLPFWSIDKTHLFTPIKVPPSCYFMASKNLSRISWIKIKCIASIHLIRLDCRNCTSFNETKGT